MVLVIASAALLLARIGFGIAEAKHPPDAAEAVDWRTAAVGESEAMQKGGVVLYFFSSPSEPESRALTNEVFADEKMARAIDQVFVPVKMVDLRKETGQNLPEVAAREQRFGVRTFPTLVAFDPKSGHFERLEGYKGVAQTMRWFSTVPPRLLGGLPPSMVGGLIGGDSSSVDSVIHLDETPLPAPAPKHGAHGK
jgi:hypothetical protein